MLPLEKDQSCAQCILCKQCFLRNVHHILGTLYFTLTHGEVIRSPLGCAHVAILNQGRLQRLLGNAVSAGHRPRLVFFTSRVTLTVSIMSLAEKAFLKTLHCPPFACSLVYPAPHPTRTLVVLIKIFVRRN